jgi:hypothetical protein
MNERLIVTAPTFFAGKRRGFIWRGWLIYVSLFGNLWFAEYWSTDRRTRGSFSWDRSASPAQVAADIMRELRAAL